MHFLEWKCMNCDENFTEVWSKGFNQWYSSIGSDNVDTYDFVQDRHNSSTLATELRLSCTNQSIWSLLMFLPTNLPGHYFISICAPWHTHTHLFHKLTYDPCSISAIVVMCALLFYNYIRRPHSWISVTGSISTWHHCVIKKYISGYNSILKQNCYNVYRQVSNISRTLVGN